MLSHSKLAKLLNNSTWIVPYETLQAFQVINMENNTIIPVSDQTVWKISAYLNGYIFGTSYTTINADPKAKTNIIGSINPYGDVLLSFYNSGANTSGQGKFTKVNDKWQFIMQMNTLNTTDQGVIGLSHWSYMISVTACDKLYHHLPGVCVSVPDFIAKFDSNNFRSAIITYLYQICY